MGLWQGAGRRSGIFTHHGSGGGPGSRCGTGAPARASRSRAAGETRRGRAAGVGGSGRGGARPRRCVAAPPGGPPGALTPGVRRGASSVGLWPVSDSSRVTTACRLLARTRSARLNLSAISGLAASDDTRLDGGNPPPGHPSQRHLRCGHVTRVLLVAKIPALRVARSHYLHLAQARAACCSRGVASERRSFGMGRRRLRRSRGISGHFGTSLRRKRNYRPMSDPVIADHVPHEGGGAPPPCF